MPPLSDTGAALSTNDRDVSIVAATTVLSRRTPSAVNVTKEQQTRRAVLRVFSAAPDESVEHLLRLSATEWKRLLSWLDVSGLALYLLNRLEELHACDALAQGVVERLRQNQTDNTQRTRGMVEESVALQLEFQRAALTYAVLKGISLSPWSVPHPQHRHQFDLDYLMDEASAPEARRILEERGYRLFAISGNCWEFKRNETPHVSVRDLYKDLPYRGVELHLVDRENQKDARLCRSVRREMFGISMPVLSPVDLFLGQALHAFKDVCSPFSRASHLLEFFRHVRTRYDDHAFWNALRERVQDDARARFGIGIVTDLITSILGDFAPVELTSWTVAALPASMRLYVDTYGSRAAFSSHPGTKFYLLLQCEMQAEGIAPRRSAKDVLLPSKLPSAVVRGFPDESLALKLARYRIQLRFFSSRLKFHAFEGFRYAVESRRWRRRMEQLS